MDIAGIVKGASEGQGLGNKFLKHIREVDAIVQVCRCFEDPDVVHVRGRVDPLADVEIIRRIPPSAFLFPSLYVRLPEEQLCRETPFRR